jgi:hypothetical protein
MARLNSSCTLPPARAYMVFKNLADNSRVLDLQFRYETGYDRQFCRAYAFFLKLRAKPDTQIEDTEFAAAQFSSANATWEPAAERDQEASSTPDQEPENPNQLQGNTAPTPPPIVSETIQIMAVAPARPILRNGPNLSPLPIPLPRASRKKRLPDSQVQFSPPMR